MQIIYLKETTGFQFNLNFKYSDPIYLFGLNGEKYIDLKEIYIPIPSSSLEEKKIMESFWRGGTKMFRISLKIKGFSRFRRFPVSPQLF